MAAHKEYSLRLLTLPARPDRPMSIPLPKNKMTRLGRNNVAATDPQTIDIKKAAREDVRREAVKADVRRGATEPGFHPERPAARDAEPPPARKAPQVMLGKDGRPLSPLSSPASSSRTIGCRSQLLSIHIDLSIVTAHAGRWRSYLLNMP